MLTIDLTEIAAILVGGALLMVPVLGLTLRLIVPPLIEAWARSRTLHRVVDDQPPGPRTQASERPQHGRARTAGSEEGTRELAAMPH